MYSYLEDAMEEYWYYYDDDQIIEEPDEHDFGMLIEWFINDYILPDKNKSILELMVNSPPPLSVEERDVLSSQVNAYISIFQIYDIEEGLGAHVQDIFTGERFFFTDFSLAAQVQKWVLLLARKIQVLNEYQVSNFVSMTNPKYGDELIQTIQDKHEEHKELFPNQKLSQFLKLNSNFTRWAFDSTRLGKPFPKLFTSSGEELIFREAFYDVLDFDSIMKKLNRAKDFEISVIEEDANEELEKIEYDWLLRGPSLKIFKSTNPGDGVQLQTYRSEEPGEQQFLVLGDIILTKTKLILKMMGEDRFSKGKKRLEKLLGETITHRVDSSKSVESALSQASSKSSKSAENSIPDDVKEKVMKDYIDRHFSDWIDNPLPALDGISPREAINTKAGKKKVVNLLREMEFLYNGKNSNIIYDVSWIREELGIG